MSISDEKTTRSDADSDERDQFDRGEAADDTAARSHFAAGDLQSDDSASDRYARDPEESAAISSQNDAWEEPCNDVSPQMSFPFGLDGEDAGWPDVGFEGPQEWGPGAATDSCASDEDECSLPEAVCGSASPTDSGREDGARLLVAVGPIDPDHPLLSLIPHIPGLGFLMGLEPCDSPEDEEDEE